MRSPEMIQSLAEVFNGEFINDRIFFIPSFLNSEEIKNILSYSELQQEEESQVYNGGTYKVKSDIRTQRLIKSNLKHMKIKESNKFPWNIIFSKIENSEIYNKTIDLLEIQITRKDQFFDWHTDGNSVVDYRICTFLIWLNDEFEGGDTEFLTKEGIISLIGNPGDAIIFDPYLWHRGSPVTYGEKKTLVFMPSYK